MKHFGITLKNELIRMIHRKKSLAGILIAAIIPMLIVLGKVLALGWNVTLIYREDLFRMSLFLFTPLMGLLQGLSSLLPIIMVLGFSVLASQYIKSGSGMILAMIGLALVMRLLPLWFGDLNSILPTTWLGFGDNIGYLSPSNILYALAIMLLWVVFTNGLAMYRFERKMV